LGADRCLLSYRCAPDSKRDRTSGVRIDHRIHRAYDHWYRDSSSVPAEKRGIGAYCFFADKSKQNHKNCVMNRQQTGLRVASVLFGLFAIGHLYRLIKQIPVQVGNHQIPMGLSWIALIIAAVLCIWLWRLASTPSSR